MGAEQTRKDPVFSYRVLVAYLTKKDGLRKSGGPKGKVAALLFQQLLYSY